MGADAVVRAGTEIEVLVFTAEASRVYLTRSVASAAAWTSSSTGETVVPVTTGRLRPNRAAGWFAGGH
jgi:hypothetical protein